MWMGHCLKSLSGFTECWKGPAQSNLTSCLLYSKYTNSLPLKYYPYTTSLTIVSISSIHFYWFFTFENESKNSWVNSPGMKVVVVLQRLVHFSLLNSIKLISSRPNTTLLQLNSCLRSYIAQTFMIHIIFSPQYLSSLLWCWCAFTN